MKNGNTINFYQQYNSAMSTLMRGSECTNILLKNSNRFFTFLSIWRENQRPLKNNKKRIQLDLGCGSQIQ